MSTPRLIQGEIFMDDRGQISSLNSFDFDGVERVYFITNKETSTIRGWHGHKVEKKWFYCVKGGFHVGLVRPDDWDSPSEDLEADIYHLKSNESNILYVPGGYANCIKATEEGSILMVFSGSRFEDCHEDSWRYDSGLWVNWDNI